MINIVLIISLLTIFYINVVTVTIFEVSNASTASANCTIVGGQQLLRMARYRSYEVIGIASNINKIILKSRTIAMRLHYLKVYYSTLFQSLKMNKTL